MQNKTSTKTSTNAVDKNPAPPVAPEETETTQEVAEDFDPALADKFKGDGKPLSRNNVVTSIDTSIPYEDLVQRLRVDQLNLENEILDHPVLYDIVGTACVELWEQVSIKKFEVDTWESAVELNLRQQLAASGEKVTESKIEALVKVDEELLEKKQELIRTQAAHMRWQDLKRAYEERSHTLKMYTSLITGNYIAYQTGT